MPVDIESLKSRKGSESAVPEPTILKCDELMQLVRESGKDLLGNEERLGDVQLVLSEIGHELIEHSTNDPENDPVKVVARILSAYQALPNESDQFERRRLSSVNRGVAKYPPNLARVRELDLSPFDEMTLLKATALAGIVRGTDDGAKLARMAVSILIHEATNVMSLGSSVSKQDTERFITAWQRIVFANQALQEIVAREGSNDFTAVDDNILLWGELAQRPTDEDVLIPHIEEMDTLGLNDGLVQFRQLTDVEKEERLKNLLVIGGQLKNIFGEDCEVTYFDTIVFDGAQEQTESDDPIRTDGETDDNDEDGEERDSGERFKDYVIAHVIQHQEDGSELDHIVAESIHYGNACYVLRGDILAEVSRLIGQEVTWKDIYGGRKNTARQLGTKDFRHAQNTDIPSRVIRYLSTEKGSILHGISLKWTESAKKIYDHELRPTRWNRLPSRYKRSINADTQRVRGILELWRSFGGSGLIEQQIGRITALPNDGEVVPEIHPLQAENDSLREELGIKTARIEELEEILRSLRRVLGDSISE